MAFVPEGPFCLSRSATFHRHFTRPHGSALERALDLFDTNSAFPVLDPRWKSSPRELSTKYSLRVCIKSFSPSSAQLVCTTLVFLKIVCSGIVINRIRASSVTYIPQKAIYASPDLCTTKAEAWPGLRILIRPKRTCDDRAHIRVCNIQL